MILQFGLIKQINTITPPPPKCCRKYSKNGKGLQKPLAPQSGIRYIGERIIRGCASAVLRVCNMIELVHAKLTHTYAATRRLSGMPVGRATVMLSVFQICWSLLKKGGLLDSP